MLKELFGMHPFIINPYNILSCKIMFFYLINYNYEGYDYAFKFIYFIVFIIFNLF